VTEHDVGVLESTAERLEGDVNVLEVTPSDLRAERELGLHLVPN
jgi:hypothetical protein